MHSSLSPAESDTLWRYRADDHRGHVESIYLMLTLSAGRRLMIEFTLLDRNFGNYQPVVDLTVLAFGFPTLSKGIGAFRRQWPLSDAQMDRSCLYLRLPGGEIRHGHSQGNLTNKTTGDTISWSFDHAVDSEGLQHQRGSWHPLALSDREHIMTPQISSVAQGEVTLNGTPYELNNAAIMLGHRWGRSRYEDWTWVHCNHFDEGTVEAFEGLVYKGSGPGRFLPRWTILHVRLPGERITMNGILEQFRIRNQREALYWKFTGTAGDRRITGWCKGSSEHAVTMDQLDPDGRVVSCATTAIANAEIQISERSNAAWTALAHGQSREGATIQQGFRGDGPSGKVHYRLGDI